MEQKINEYVAPDLSEFDKQLAVLQEDMKIAKESEYSKAQGAG